MKTRTISTVFPKRSGLMTNEQCQRGLFVFTASKGLAGDGFIPFCPFCHTP